MKNKKINLFFKSNIREVTHKDENKINSIFLHNLKYHTNNTIVQLEK